MKTKLGVYESFWFERNEENPDYPVNFVLSSYRGRPHTFCLSVSEVEDLTEGLHALLAPAPPRYVTVKIIGQDEREWHYEDTSGTLEKDDLVRVNWGGANKVGIIRATGVHPPKFLDGYIIKPVLARFEAEDL